MLDLVLNEISCQQKPSRREAWAIIEEFIDTVRLIRRLAGRVPLRVDENSVDCNLAEGYSLRDWSRDPLVRRDPKGRDRQLLFKTIILQPPLIGSSDPPSVFSDFQDFGIEARLVGSEAQEAKGALAAYLLNGLSISLRTAEIWDVEYLTLILRHLTDDDQISDTKISIRHVSRPDHTQTHADWIAHHDPSRGPFRLAVDPKQAVYVDASTYAKHVRGSGNEQRQEQARRTDNGQYLAELDGQSVTDATIKSWEKSALEAALYGESGRVECHGGAFHVYVTQPHSVGYLGRSGELTSDMRVEWSCGHVHSHPRKMKD